MDVGVCLMIYVGSSFPLSVYRREDRRQAGVAQKKTSIQLHIGKDIQHLLLFIPCVLFLPTVVFSISYTIWFCSNFDFPTEVLQMLDFRLSCDKLYYSGTSAERCRCCMSQSDRSEFIEPCKKAMRERNEEILNAMTPTLRRRGE